LEEALSLAPSLATALDKDQDGELTYEELRGLNEVEPQIVLAANFGKPGDKVAGVSLVLVTKELGEADRIAQHTPNGMLFTFDGYRLLIVLDDRAPANSGEPSVEEQFAMLDKDKNGYIDKDEAAEVAPDVGRMFDEVDANGDGKVYLDELTAYRRKQQAPQLSAIRAVASDDQDVLFPLLDVNHDGRLTTRELKAARASLLALDTDGDGRISLEELPGGLTLALARGLPSNMAPRRSMFATVQEPAAASGPAWFTHMDANRDQEVSLDEFPGNPEKFRSLDVDGDGFVSASEALATGSGVTGSGATGDRE
jgi:Ca2+-binding EF-hand superfamily protein